VDEKDIFRAAHAMIKRFGEDADVEAAVRADELLKQGDANGAAAFRRIVRAIKELERTERHEDEQSH
jgi:hypothetical protein